MDFFLSFTVFFFSAVTDISHHFPRIKNPFWIIHSILNLADTCIHNKLNLLRRLWDLSWMCRWQTTKILSFIFNATGRVTLTLSSRMSNRDPRFLVVTQPMRPGGVLSALRSNIPTLFFIRAAGSGPGSCVPWSPVQHSDGQIAAPNTTCEVIIRQQLHRRGQT